MRIYSFFVFSLLFACGKKETAEPSTEETDIDADGDGSLEADDCDDNDASRYPGAEEICDGIDNNCDDEIDNDATDVQTFYADADGDGFGDMNTTEDACSASDGFVDNMDDCDDSNAAIAPDAEDVCDDIDNNCDGLVDENLDLIASYLDADGDGFGSEEMMEDCLIPEGYSDNMDDCDDEDPLIGSSLEDMDCDGLLNTEDDDADGDGVLAENDCDDSDANMVQRINSVESVSTDEDGDGIPETVTTYTYNEQGRVVGKSDVYDLNGDETDDEIYTAYTYDADGNVTSGEVTYDYGIDGTPEITYTFVVTSDADGNILTSQGNGSRIDGSTFSYTYTYTYDANGNRTTEIFEADWSGSGTTEQSSMKSYTYDPVTGYLMSTTEDALNSDGESLIDGVSEDTRTYTYDADGNTLTMDVVFDDNSDGANDAIYSLSYVYNENSGLLDSYTLNYDWDADGTVDVVYTYSYSYNADETRASEEMVVEYVLEQYQSYNYTKVTTYTYNTEGLLILTEIDDTNDGEIDTVYANTYNEDNQLITSEDADGSYTYTYVSCPE